MFNKYKNIFFSKNKKQQSSLIGFILSVILTIIPFIIINDYNFFSKKIIFLIIVFCALIQIIIHCKYFLNLKLSIDQRWYWIFFIFAIFIAIILILGSIWIFSNLYQNSIIN